ncbi:5'-methylthioadenosine/S-adenosylhomocysteine nucleosidase [Colwellia sp. 1_MG-2023]|uniref:5'-methylthioadenosine/S-adenosylhomocysteine nucleosidase n=1 Tax=unclassified Colwellia TaxID=196834 RepID=UPI001C09189A|nr:MULTISPECIES: 5'-methylthioadenosine/S-adenosylhomocysteine nucleosidase [unclassified Colwellia]MBU2923893.1 5'-methylthioadenosine/S-adenosylhomocysteine nucleosidase [Colwellia sp. C2M11]MDO6653035.1 5'-methylthioadenosine/S-adenosylhomocysteine nucleosidase [Colwellia sp. 3_MG-2023]MDO6665978.1 5'-methylthioadenosine/S-adenosylhomocysteine nucleosidase [Colwellia sp. 2_MG-2023]MDO6690351.1 5'-methylthioadenosine/S-adenosylhomocysteine nucleosidase [Colwellia sp. 1_MG-2023]
MNKLLTQFILLFTALFIQLNANATTMKSTITESAVLAPQPILIEAPMPIEAEYLAKRLSNVRIEYSGYFTFYIGTLDNYPVIVAETGKGLENTAAATAIAIERYRPLAIINQGTSGGHDPALMVGDIVLGKRTVNIGNFKTSYKKNGQGSDPFSWIPMDIMASKGSAGEDSGAQDAEKIRFYAGSPTLLNSAIAVKGLYKRGKVVEGTIGSANFWNNEIDRILWFHKNFGTSAEEMEGAAAAMIASEYNIPMLSIRVLSNNLTNGGKYDPSTAQDCQQFVLNTVKHYIATL